MLDGVAAGVIAAAAAADDNDESADADEDDNDNDDDEDDNDDCCCCAAADTLDLGTTDAINSASDVDVWEWHCQLSLLMANTIQLEVIYE